MNKLDVLVSYYYIKQPLIDIMIEYKDHFNYIIDSGAFTAFKTGKTIDLDHYIRFLHETKIPYEWYFTLDKIGDSKKTKENYEEMKKQGLLPVPIFTRGDTEESYWEYYNDRKFIGIGGIAGTTGNKKFLYSCQEKFAKGTKQHWLGFWQKDFLIHYKPYSCDTMTWYRNKMFGDVYYYKNKQLIQIPKISRHLGEDNKSSLSSKIIWFKRYAKNLGIPDYMFKKSDYWATKDKRIPIGQTITTCAFIEFAKMIKEQIGTRIFFVCSGVLAGSELQVLYHSKEVLKNGFNGCLTYK